MQFDSEAALQAYCLNILRSREIEAQEEVWAGGIRADVVTPECVYELKKVLNRESLYQALGQATAYNQHLNRRYICIVGQSPSDPDEFRQALTIARAISNESVRVSFVDRDSFWHRGNVSLSNWLHLNFTNQIRAIVKEGLWMLGIGVIGALCVCVVVNYFWTDQESPNSASIQQVSDK